MDSGFPLDERSQWSLQFLASFPPKFRIDAARIIRESSVDAHNLSPEVLPGLRRDKYPHDRRAFVETNLVLLADKYRTSGLRGREVLNGTRNHRHAEIISGNVVLIAAAVEAEDEIPRWAAYRTTLAEDPQLALFGEERPPTLPDNALLAIMLYGPRSAYPRSFDEAVPGFVVVRFPANKWEHWAEGRVDLWGRMVEYERQKEQGLESYEEEEQA